jgi:hypothetical protein
MKKVINIISAVIIIFFNSCDSKKKENNSSKTQIIQKEEVESAKSNNYSDTELDKLLKCGDYSYMDGYFTIPDYGCIYQPETINKLGNVEVYLLPKSLQENFDFEKEEAKISKMDLQDLKKFFNIYVLIIDKKYLIHNVKMDIPYYPKYPYKQDIYKYNDGVYKFTSTLNIKDQKDTEYNEWKTKFLVQANQPSQSLISDLKGDYTIKTKVSSVETGDPIDISFYFSFNDTNATLSIGTNNSLEAYCEGNFNIEKKDNMLKLKYSDAGTCTSDEDESSFLIKRENNLYYIKSKRFYDFKWQILNKK